MEEEEGAQSGLHVPGRPTHACKVSLMIRYVNKRVDTTAGGQHNSSTYMYYGNIGFLTVTFPILDLFELLHISLRS